MKIKTPYAEVKLRGSAVYISGPITGIENWEKNFIEAEKLLLQFEPREIVNPLTLSKELEKKSAEKPTYADYMRNDLRKLLACDAIFLLPGYQSSKGASLEAMAARTLGMAVVEAQ